MNQLQQFILNHWLLWLALIAILALIFLNEWLAQKKRAKQVTPAQAVHLINDDATIIDLRDKETYNNGHIINAIQASSDDFTQQKMDKYKEKTLILVCTRGIQSAALASKLKAAGFLNPLVLGGGMTAWTSENLPIVKGKK